ncbi:MAG: cell division protein SepF [Clostridiales bacterium]|nr:cell division protein SepF [Clostridiales bacterium]
MGILENFKRYVRGEDYDDEEFDEVGSPVRESAPARQDSQATRSFTRSDEYSAYSASDRRQSNRVVNINTVTQLAVVLVKPEDYESVSEIADHLKDKRTVVLNLEHANREIARRILDFLSGVAYAHEGKIKKIANSTFIITPYNVEIQGNIIDELENNGLYL